jgi:hypothetical protein
MQLPEVVRAVLLHVLDDRPSLHAALLVSRAWFASGVDLLWCAPSSNALECVAPPRRQFYASYIIASDGIPSPVLADSLLLPRLRRLRLLSGPEASDDAAYNAMLHYLRPTLEHLSCHLTPALLSRVTSRPLPRLRSLALRNRGSSDSAAWAFMVHVCDWLSHLPHPPLRTLCLYIVPVHVDAALMEHAMEVLSDLPALQQLEFRGLFLPHLNARASCKVSNTVAYGEQSPTPRPLGRSHSLTITLLDLAMPAALGNLFPCITELYLDACGQCSVLPAVAQLTTLRSLKVHLAERWSDHSRRLQSLQSLTQLRTLWLAGSSADSVFGTNLAELLLLGTLGELEQLGIFLETVLSEQFSVNVGLGCPALRTLMLFADAPLAAAVSHPGNVALFPNLNNLTVRSLICPEDVSSW